MLEGTQSGCINHPGIEGRYRCKQCGTPVCGGCVQKAPSGNFCSVGCREKYDTFVERARTVGADMKKGPKAGLFTRLKSALGKLLLVLLVLAGLAVAGTLWPIPILSDLVFRLRGIAGL